MTDVNIRSPDPAVRPEASSASGKSSQISRAGRLRRAMDELLLKSLAELSLLLSVPTIRTALITAAVFVFDWLMPLGISAGVLYMAAVLSAVSIPRRRSVYTTAGVCSLLVLLDWWLSPDQSTTELWKIIANRSLSIGVLWTAAAMVDSLHRIQERRVAQLQENRLLQQATAMSVSHVSFRQALQNSVKSLCEILGCTAGHVYVMDRSGFLVASDIWHVPEDSAFELLRMAAHDLRFARGEHAPGQIWQTGKPLVVDDVANSPCYSWFKEPERLGIRGAFAFPITVSGKVVAVMEFFSSHQFALDFDFVPLSRNIGEQLGRLFERKRSDEALRESEERLRLAFQSGHMGTWEWQIDTGRVYWSPEIERIHGRDPGSFEGTFDAFQADIHPDDRRHVQQRIEEAIERQDEFQIEYRIIRPDQSVQWVEGRGAVHQGTDGKPVRLVGVCMNITERKQSEEATHRAKEAAEAANRVRSQFLANVSHELRTPMNSVLGMLQLALHEPLPDELRDQLETAKDSADSLLRLLSDLLDFSRLEAGRIRIQAAPFSLRETMDDTLRSLAPRAFGKGLEIVYDVDEDVPERLVGDAIRLRQILTNLINNAITFTERGEVLVRITEEARIPGYASLQFTVADTGVGISAEEQQKIFEPFTQADASTTRNYGGFGLGLAICQELVRNMGGQLSVESELNRGSRFWFTLTLPRQTDCQWKLPEDIAARLYDMSVLVVDDNESNRRTLERTLTAWGMHADVAVDADHAIGRMRRSIAEHKPYQLMLIDQDMPGMDGLSLAETVTEDLSPVPAMVLMTCGDQRLAPERGRSELFSAYLSKPMSSERLLDAVATGLGVTACEPRHNALPERDVIEPPSLSILLAEDTPANQKVVVGVLKKRGHRVTIARNGREALDLFRSRPFDVVLMDVQMPVMDGYQATAAIRAAEQERQGHTPIIAMTAHAMQGDREACLTAGMDTYIAKPIDVQRLVDAVERMGQGTAMDPQDADMRDDRFLGPKPPAAPSSIVDVVGTLRRLGGDTDLFRQFIQVYEEDRAELLAALQRAVSERNAQALERPAHSLKGLVANFGAPDATSVAQRLEQMGRQGQIEGAAEALQELEHELVRLSCALTDVQLA
jgi:two-component system, sensor histidine kinase and response regulator